MSCSIRMPEPEIAVRSSSFDNVSGIERHWGLIPFFRCPVQPLFTGSGVGNRTKVGSRQENSCRTAVIIQYRKQS